MGSSLRIASLALLAACTVRGGTDTGPPVILPGTPPTTTGAATTPAGSGTTSTGDTATRIELAIHPRSEWEEPGYEITGPDQPTEIDFLIIHYPGADLGSSLEDTVALLRAAQRDWTDNRGYSLGYNWYVGRGGLDDIWEVRGFDHKNAANGPVSPPNPDLGDNGNDRTVALKFVTNLDGELSPEQIEAGPVVADWIRQELGRPLEVQPHSWVNATACPGDPMRALIEAGWLDPS